MAAVSDLYSDLLAALTTARSAILSPEWQAELDQESSDVRVAAGKAGMDLQGAILTLSNANLSDIATEMQANETALITATNGLTQALADITKVQDVLSSIAKAITIVGKIVTLV